MGVRKNRRNEQWKGLNEGRQPLNNFSPRSFFLSLHSCPQCPWTIDVLKYNTVGGPWTLIAIGH
jgi:hypothetical protein